ncbi:Protein CBG19958 [Caenorhabditis briggsae]|uniref:Protein CBG19958 n=1 Tax=Caenorhabditis briggsae TaxID=6238 RepID=A8XWT5_CAEBR|nr:Protein CBG19958 [Caenorhabditis briggsae]CAP37104.2 Protein CBG19958 [Caenorhabditis briggsae]
MATESGGLSKAEFLLVQEQLLLLKNENYELREEIKKKNAQQQHQNSPKNEALQFASKLLSKASSSKKDEEKSEIDALRRKLETQEEEFRLQQSTLFEELKTLSSQNQELKDQIGAYSEHPLEKEAGRSLEELEADLKSLTEEKTLLSQETIPSLNKKISSLKDELENCQTLNVELEDRLLTMTTDAEASYGEKEQLVAESLSVMQEMGQLREENQSIVDEMQLRNDEIVEENRKLAEENRELKSRYEELEKLKTENSNLLAENKLNQEISKKFAELQEEKRTLSEISQQEIFDLKKELELVKAENTKLSSEIEQNAEKSAKNHEKLLEDRVLLLETRYQLEVDDLKKSFETEKEEFRLKIVSLEEKLKSAEEDKKMAVKKSTALVKELQKSLKEERKRADSYERKSEERSGWHVVPPENDRQSSHVGFRFKKTQFSTFDGNESVSSMSAIESENVELITRLATLQKIHSENADTILQLESENSRLRREVTEKGELIENLIREKPLGAGFQPNGSGQHPKIEVSFRKLLNTLGQDSRDSDVREMNKKLQRMLEETLSKNIILQRNLQTLMERS